MNKYDLSEIRLSSLSRPDSAKQPGYDSVSVVTSIYIKNKKTCQENRAILGPLGNALGLLGLHIFQQR